MQKLKEGLQHKTAGWRNIRRISAGAAGVACVTYDGSALFAARAARYKNISYDVSGWKSILDISVNSRHIVGLKFDGSVVAMGDNDKGQCDVSKWKNIIAVSAGWDHTAGLKEDGSAVAVGENFLEAMMLVNGKT